MNLTIFTQFVTQCAYIYIYIYRYNLAAKNTFCGLNLGLSITRVYVIIITSNSTHGSSTDSEKPGEPKRICNSTAYTSYSVAFVINSTNIYNNNLYNTQCAYHLSVFNSIEITRSTHSCIFYFVNNGIAGTEESSKLFFVFSLR